MVNVFSIIVVIGLIFMIFLFVKLKYIKHKVSWIVVLFLALVFYIGFLASTAGQNIDFATFDGSQTAIKLYMSWLGNSFDNMKVLTGQAINLDWGTNSTQIIERVRG